MSEQEAVLRAELVEVRAAAVKREEELSRMVANAKEIFDLNLSHESSRLERKYRTISDEKDGEISALRSLLSGKEKIIAGLSQRISMFEQDKLQALREQRQSVMLASELANCDLAQSRAAAERQRYDSERILRLKDGTISHLNDRVAVLDDCLEDSKKAILNGVLREEASLRSAIEDCQGMVSSLMMDSFRAIGGGEMYRTMCEQLMLRGICQGVVTAVRARETLPQPLPIPLTLTLDNCLHMIASAFEAQFSSIEATLEAATARNEALAVEHEGTRLRCLQVNEAMAKFAVVVSDRLNTQNAALVRAVEMQSRLRERVGRNAAAKQASSETIEKVTAAFEADVVALRAKIVSLEETITTMYPEDQVTNLAAQLSTSQQALNVLRDQLARSDGRMAQPNAPLNDDIAEGPAAAHPDAFSSTPPVESLGRVDPIAIDPFSRWEAPEHGAAQHMGDSAGFRASPTREHMEAQEENAALRKELAAARSNIVDLKGLVRRLKEQRPLGVSVNSVRTPRTARPSISQTEELTQRIPTPNSSVPDQDPRFGASHAAAVVSPNSEQHTTSADGELQMQIFTLRRERDAWKRKADAALAQASHAEEQRLASVHTYLQLVSRKEEDYAHHILSGGSGKVGASAPIGEAGTAVSERDSLMPGGISQTSSRPIELAGVIHDVRVRGEERAERWLVERADALRAQTIELNRLRDELAVKASGLTRREEALQHEKTGIMLKKGGGVSRPGGLTSLLLGPSTERQQEPLRETVPATRLRPMLQVSVPSTESKPHHPQRYVLAPLPPK